MPIVTIITPAKTIHPTQPVASSAREAEDWDGTRAPTPGAELVSVMTLSLVELRHQSPHPLLWLPHPRRVTLRAPGAAATPRPRRGRRSRWRSSGRRPARPGFPFAGGA